VVYASFALRSLVYSKDHPLLSERLQHPPGGKLVYPVILVCLHQPRPGVISKKNIEVQNCGNLQGDIEECSTLQNRSPTKRSCLTNVFGIEFPAYQKGVELGLQYACAIVNADKPVPESLKEQINKDLSKCEDRRKGQIEQQPKEFIQAFAEGSTLDDAFSFKVDLSSLTPATTLRIGFFPSIEDINPTSASQLTLRFQQSSSHTFILSRNDFKCINCDDYKTFFNASDNYEKNFGGRVTMVYQSFVIRQQVELYAMSVLDYLGNIAGMMGVLLGAAVLTLCDRAFSYFIVKHHYETVWVQPE